MRQPIFRSPMLGWISSRSCTLRRIEPRECHRIPSYSLFPTEALLKISMNHGVSWLHLLSDKGWKTRALLTNPKVVQDFGEHFMSSGINLTQENWDTSLIGGFDDLLLGSFSAEEFQAAFSISASGSSWALNDIPWFRFQQLIKTTGLYSRLRTSEVDWRLTTNSW